jgi:hypothetical protein
MRFLTFVRSSEQNGPPPSALMAAIGQLGAEAAKDGTLVLMGGLYQSAKGAKVRLEGGKITVTDGPFTESKEVIGGFAMHEVKSYEEAVALTVKFMELHRIHWPGWSGESELRQVYDAP